MKRNKNISKNLLAGMIGVLIVLSLLLTSCIKDDTTPPPPTALLSFIQASPDEPALNFFFDGHQVNQTPLNYGDQIDYFSTFAGQGEAYMYTAGATSPAIVEAPVNLVANTAYSLFMVNTESNPGILLLADTLIKPTAGNASVRFVDASPDAPAVDLAVQGGAVLVSNRSFEGYSSFIPIAGKSNYTFQILQTGTNTVLATLPNVTLNSGYVYTLIFQGLWASTGSTDKLSAGLITNAYFN
jgi:hypothetical protein